MLSVIKTLCVCYNNVIELKKIGASKFQTKNNISHGKGGNPENAPFRLQTTEEEY